MIGSLLVCSVLCFITGHWIFGLLFLYAAGQVFEYSPNRER